MGVTIHFEGRLRNSDAYQAVVNTATRFADAPDAQKRRAGEGNVMRMEIDEE